VIEVVSPSSVDRDYEEKPDEYLQFGIREYWIVDAEKQQLLTLRRSRGKWADRIVRPSELYQTGLLPDFEFDCEAVFVAASA
jgi:Uma2 family endonuclease